MVVAAWIIFGVMLFMTFYPAGMICSPGIIIIKALTQGKPSNF